MNDEPAEWVGREGGREGEVGIERKLLRFA